MTYYFFQSLHVKLGQNILQKRPYSPCRAPATATEMSNMVSNDYVVEKCFVSVINAADNLHVIRPITRLTSKNLRYVHYQKTLRI
jgi:hypothetical protein